MASDAPRVLVCLIEGESVAFEVEAAGSMRIMGLKGLIRKEGINPERRDAVLAKDLTLWKVRMTIASDSTTNSPAGRSCTPSP